MRLVQIRNKAGVSELIPCTLCEEVGWLENHLDCTSIIQAFGPQKPKEQYFLSTQPTRSGTTQRVSQATLRAVRHMPTASTGRTQRGQNS